MKKHFFFFNLRLSRPPRSHIWYIQKGEETAGITQPLWEAGTLFSLLRLH